MVDGDANWMLLSGDELSIVDDLDNMESSMTSFETQFLSDVINKLEKYGEMKAQFTEKQRNLIKRLASKYLD